MIEPTVSWASTEVMTVLGVMMAPTVISFSIMRFCMTLSSLSSMTSVSSAMSAMTDISSRVMDSSFTEGSSFLVFSMGQTMGARRKVIEWRTAPELRVKRLQYSVPIVFGRISERRRTSRVRMVEATASAYSPG